MKRMTSFSNSEIHFEVYGKEKWELKASNEDNTGLKSSSLEGEVKAVLKTDKIKIKARKGVLGAAMKTN